MTAESVKMASFSGRDSGAVVIGLLRTAFQTGELADLRKQNRDDEHRWIEFHYCSADDESGQSIFVATDDNNRVVGGELWKTEARPRTYTYEADGLIRNLRFVDSLESVQEAIVGSDGELIAICLMFSEGTRSLLVRR